MQRVYVNTEQKKNFVNFVKLFIIFFNTSQLSTFYFAEVKNVQFVEGQSSSAHQSAVYYLAQQQLKLMKVKRLLEYL